jgi:hypothetical protein
MDARCFLPARPVFFISIAWLFLVQVGLARADCLGAGGALPPDQVAKLQTNPAGIFLNAQGSPMGNAELITRVRDLVTAEKAALKAVIEALKLANAEEKSAIGTALGQAAQACLTTQATYAADIQEQLAASTDQDAILAFAAVTGNVAIGATGGGAGGAGGGAGGSSAGSGSSSGGGGAAAGGGGGSSSPTGSTFTAAAATTTPITLVTTPTAATTTTVVTTNTVAITATSVSP